MSVRKENGRWCFQLAGFLSLRLPAARRVPLNAPRAPSAGVTAWLRRPAREPGSELVVLLVTEGIRGAGC